MTFSELAQARLTALATDGGSEKTRRSYYEAYSLFVRYLGSKGLKNDAREFTPENVAGFKEWLAALPAKRRGEKYKGSSICNRLAALSSLGKWAMSVERPAKDRLSENPVLRVTRPKRGKPPEKILYRDELTTLMGFPCAPNERLVLDAFFATALRVTEVAEARRAALHPGTDEMTMQVRLKGGRYKAIALGPEFSAKLAASLDERKAGPDSPVFVNQAGRAYTRTSLSEVVARIAKRAGITRIPVRPHVLRHTFATYAGANGASVVEIADMLNHSDTSTAAKYLHSLPGREAAARERARVALRG